MDSSAPGGDHSRLLWSVAEQLKLPLSVIARRAELAEMSGDYSVQDAASIRTQADIGLALIDSYLLGIDLWRQQSSLPLEAVSVSSVMADTAHGLYKYARQLGVSIDMSVDGRYGPVMANPRGLRAAMLALGCALVEAVQTDKSGKPKLTLAVHRNEQGIVAGIYGLNGEFNPRQWRGGQGLYGQSPQPMPTLHGSGAGLFVADAILQAMETNLIVGRHGRQAGLKAVFIPSQQLTLV